MRIKLYILSVLLLLIVASKGFSQDSHECTLYCSPFPWSYRLYVSPLLTDLKSNLYASEEKQKMGYNVGGELIYSFLKTNKFGMNLALGLAITNYNSSQQTNLTNKLWTSEYEQTVSGNQSYYLTETANNIIENQHIMFLDIPIKLGFEYQIAHRWVGYANIGIAYGLNVSAKYDNTAIITRTGYYPDYNVLLYNIDIPGSSYYFPTNKAISGSGFIGKQNNFITELALGVKYKINTKLTAFAGAKMMTGSQNIKSNPSSIILAQSDNTMNTLMNRNDNVKTQAYGLEFGLQINFGKCRGTNENTTNEVENITKENKTKENKIKENKIVEKKTNKDKSSKNKVVKNKIIENRISEPENIEKVELDGKIINSKTAVPLKATIVIKNNGDIINTIETDNNGQFNVEVTNGNIYELEVYAQGFKPQQQTIDLTNNTENIQKDFASEPIIQSIVFNGRVIDARTRASVKSSIIIKSNSEVIKTVEVDAYGQFNIYLPKGSIYELEITVPEYESFHQTLDLTSINNDIQRDLILIPKIQGVELLGKVIDSKTFSSVKATMVIKKDDEVINTIVSGDNGLIRFSVPEGNVYIIDIVAPGYTTQHKIADLTKTANGVRKEIPITALVRAEKRMVFNFDNINFNSGTDYLSLESMKKLNMVLRILNENPNMQISISGHTDNIECSVSNKDLSTKRATAVMNYLQNKGAKPYQLKSYGYGCTKAIATNNTNEGKALNRRVELKVIGY